MKRLILSMMLSCAALPASADCNPPAGLSIAQFQYVCGTGLAVIYYSRFSQRMTQSAFLQMMYGGYLRMTGGQSGLPGPTMMCSVGEFRCRSGWVARCESMATGGTWWVTGVQRCSR